MQLVEVDVGAPEFRRIVPEGTSLERIPVGFHFGEGPVWNARDRYLLWTDAFEDRIYKWAPNEGVSVFLEPSGRALAVTYDRHGRLTASGWSARTIWRIESDGRMVVVFANKSPDAWETLVSAIIRAGFVVGGRRFAWKKGPAPAKIRHKMSAS